MVDTSDLLKVSEWLAGDDTGLSSKSLAREFLGLSHDQDRYFKGINYPLDPADIGRCFRLIEMCPPVRDAVFSLATKSDMWKKLSERWDEIYASMNNEVGIHWQKGKSAPKTYTLMESILD